MARTRPMMVRVTEEERARIAQAALAAGQPVSAWVRLMAMRATGRPIPAVAARTPPSPPPPPGVEFERDHGLTLIRPRARSVRPSAASSTGIRAAE